MTEHATREDISLEWSGEQLLTRRTRTALYRPDVSRTDAAPAWSNLLAFLSEWTLDPAVRGYLVSALGREALPFETTFGDGEPFTAAHVATVNAAYDEVCAYVTWRSGDVLLLDNRRTAHSLEPFTGRRSMAVVHAEPANGDQPASVR